MKALMANEWRDGLLTTHRDEDSYHLKVLLKNIRSLDNFCFVRHQSVAVIWSSLRAATIPFVRRGHGYRSATCAATPFPLAGNRTAHQNHFLVFPRVLSASATR